jgi:Bacterial Ig domain
MKPSSLLAPIYRTGPASFECGTHQHRRLARWRIASALLLPALVLAGCGGSEGEDPEITLAVAPTSAAAGATITLLALATDEDGSVEEVEMYRLTSSGNVLLGTLNSQPYQMQVDLPDDASGTVSFFARAIDDDDNTTDSATVTVTVTD